MAKITNAKPNLELHDMNINAHAQGLSYGKLVAKTEMPAYLSISEKIQTLKANGAWNYKTAAEHRKATGN